MTRPRIINEIKIQYIRRNHIYHMITTDFALKFIFNQKNLKLIRN